MDTIENVAKYIRSKNAGPFWVTLEIFCDTQEAYDKIKNSPNVNAHKVAELYNVDEKAVQTFYLDNVLIIKFSYPRPKPAGHKYENDMHAGQQYIFLVDVAL